MPNNHTTIQQDDIDIQCGQIQLGIPYRKITELKFTLQKPKQQIRSQTKSQQMFRISVECKYEGLSKLQKPTIINRTICDFQWLQTALHQHVQSRFVILPMLAKQASLKDTLIGYFANKLSSQYSQKMDNEMIKNNQYKKQQDKNQQQRETNPNYHAGQYTNWTQTMLQRYMNILSSITVRNLYHKPNQFQNPIFIFIQQKDTYSFYLSLYEKEKKSKENVIKQYFAGLLNYVPTFSKQKSIKPSGLQTIFNQYQKLHNKSTQLLQKLSNYNHSLSTLSQNFIQKQHRNRIKQKLKILYTLINSLNYFMKYLNLVIDQIACNMQFYDSSIDSSSNSINNNGMRQADQHTIKRQIEQYSIFVGKQRQFIQSALTKISQEFIVQTTNVVDNFDNKNQLLLLGQNNNNNRVRISLGELYDDFSQVK